MSKFPKQPLDQAKIAAIEFQSRYLTGARTEVCGSIRREVDMVGDIDIMTDADLRAVGNALAADGIGARIGDKTLFFMHRGFSFNVYHSEHDSWGAMMHFLTGPMKYCIAYRSMAAKRGWRLNQYGLFSEMGIKIAGDTEESIYKALGRNWKDPALRGL